MRAVPATRGSRKNHIGEKRVFLLSYVKLCNGNTKSTNINPKRKPRVAHEKENERCRIQKHKIGLLYVAGIEGGRKCETQGGRAEERSESSHKETQYCELPAYGSASQHPFTSGRPYSL